MPGIPLIVVWARIQDERTTSEAWEEKNCRYTATVLNAHIFVTFHSLERRALRYGGCFFSYSFFRVLEKRPPCTYTPVDNRVSWVLVAVHV